MTAPTTRGVATVLRHAGYRSHAVDRQHRCPARGYDVYASGDTIVVAYRSDRPGDTGCSATLEAWAGTLSRWDVTREPDRLVVRGRVSP